MVTNQILFPIMRFPILSFRLQRNQRAFGRVAVEGQAMGKPVIASAHGGALETVRDGLTGWLFENDNALDLAMKMRAALSSGDDLKRIGRNARTFVEENYTVEKCVGQNGAHTGRFLVNF